MKKYEVTGEDIKKLLSDNSNLLKEVIDKVVDNFCVPAKEVKTLDRVEVEKIVISKIFKNNMTEWKYNSHRLRYKEAITAICNLSVSDLKLIAHGRIAFNEYIYPYLIVTKNDYETAERVTIENGENLKLSVFQKIDIYIKGSEE
jgi:hypothetical protein